MACSYSVRVELNVQAGPGKTGKPARTGLRKFIVEYDEDGFALRIKEIRELLPPQIGIYHAPYWYAKSHTKKGLPERIIAAADAKMRAEHRADNATP